MLFRFTTNLVLISFAAICIFMVCEARVRLRLSEDEPTDRDLAIAAKRRANRRKSYFVEYDFNLSYIPKGGKESKTKSAFVSCYIKEPTTVGEVKSKVKGKPNASQYNSCKEDNSIYRNGIKCKISGAQECDEIKNWCEQDLGGKAQFNIDCPFGAF